jgi:hypothetical protein
MNLDNSLLENIIIRFIELKLIINLIPYRHFIKNFDKNPYYPFKQLNSYVFEYNYNCYFSGIICLIVSILLASISIINFKIFKYHKSVSFFLALLLLIFFSIIFFLFGIISFAKRTVRLNLLKNLYDLLIQDKLIATNHIHNLYIRLNEKHILKTKLVYRLTLCGKDMDTIIISPYSHNLQTIRNIGRRLAQNLFLSYFDIHDLSFHHSIINFCPLDESKIDLWKYLIQEKEIILQKNKIYWKKPNLIQSKTKKKKRKNNSMSLNLTACDQSQNLSIIESEGYRENSVVSSQELRLKLSKLANGLNAVKTISNVL